MNEYIRRIIRFLKEENCYVSFVKNFYSKNSIEWRKRKYCDLNVLNLQDFLKFEYDLLSQNIEETKINDYFHYIISASFPWIETKEGCEFWVSIIRRFLKKNG